MRLCFLLSLLLVLSGCSIPSDQPPNKKAPQLKALVRPSDESYRFPPQDRVKVEIVEGHMLGKELLPAGNLAEYSRSGKTFHLFLIETKSSLDATLLMNDFQKTLTGSKFIPHMGGYFGMDGEQPVYVFPKGNWLAGLVGLPQDEADVLAREFAARL